MTIRQAYTPRLASLWLLISLFILLTSAASCFIGYAVDGLGRGFLARTNDSGASWIPVLRGPVNLSAIAFPTTTSLIAVGYNGSIIGPSASSNGTIWSDPISVQFTYMTVSPPTREQFRTVLFISPNIGIAGGTRGILYRSADRGVTWTSVKPVFLFRVVNNLFRAGSNVMAVGNAGLILQSSDTGLTWSRPIGNISYTGGNARNLYCGSSLDSQRYMIVGYGGTLIKTSDGGNTFSTSYIPIGYDSTLAYNSIYYYDANIIYISGESGLLIRSLDGGNTFRPLNVSLSLPSVRITSMQFMPSSATRSMTAIGLPDSVIAVASVRNRILLTRFTDGFVWVESTPTKLNFIENIALLPSPVCYPTPSEFVIAAVSGRDIPFNLTIQNTGTQDLIISSIVVSTNLITLSSNSPSNLYARPLDPSTRFFFVFAAAGLNRGVYTGMIQFIHNSPSGSTRIPVKVIVVQSPSINEPTFFQQYWWALALSVLAIFAIIAYFVRRRLRHIRAYNRRVRDPDLHLSFWRFWCCRKVQEHDSDSDFWLEQEDDGDWDDEEEEEDEDDDEDEDESDADGDESVDSEDSDGVKKQKRKRGGKGKGRKGKKRVEDSDSDSISDQDYSEKDVMKQILKNRYDVSVSREEGGDESSQSRKSSNSRKQIRRLSMKPSSGASSAGIPANLGVAASHNNPFGHRKSIYVGAGGANTGGVGLGGATQSIRGPLSSKKFQ